MPKIFHLLEQIEPRWELDPTRGAVKRMQSVVKQSDTERIKFKDREFEIGDDGSFDVDNETAVFLVGRNGWHEGVSPFAPEYLKKAADKKAAEEAAKKAEAEAAKDAETETEKSEAAPRQRRARRSADPAADAQKDDAADAAESAQ